MVYSGQMAREPVGERIREARAAKGWMQKHLAAEVEVEPITVSRWERGATTPDLDVLRLVADATGKPLSYFVSDPKEEADLERRVAALERMVQMLEQKLDALASDQ
jgi:transcriptional regulator with XRE-family HTH domain